MERQCGKCKGQGGRYRENRNRPKGGLASWYTSSKEWIKCDVCNGSGVNPNYREKQCERCYRTIGYHKDAQYPPKYCQSCKGIVAQEKAAKQRERERQNAMWREKSCPGLKGQGYCGKTIKYRVDWDKIPDICSDCRNKAKAQKAERDSKRRTKPCKRCGSEIVYYTDGKEFDFCKSCNDQRVKVDRNEKGTLQAKAKDGTLLFTFGRCTEPPPNKQGGKSDDKREWARKGYYWVSMPDNPHLTYIIDTNPVVDGFISKVSTREHISTVYPSAWLKNLWETVSVALLRYGD